MKIQINKVHYPVTTLGPGRRLGIWFQGCSLHCPGCVSRDTWQSGSDHETTIIALLTQLHDLTGGRPDGVTISGGEPFEQPSALLALLHGFSQWPARQRRELDILVYSGLSLETLESRHRAILDIVDVVIADPYVTSLAPGGRLRGSVNQRLSVRTSLGRSRFSDGFKTEESAPAALQVTVDERHVWIIGIPRPGDLTTVERAAARRGITLGRVSWHA